MALLGRQVFGVMRKERLAMLHGLLDRIHTELIEKIIAFTTQTLGPIAFAKILHLLIYRMHIIVGKLIVGTI